MIKRSVGGRATMILPEGDDHLANIINRTGTWYELDLLEAIQERVGPYKRYLDIGAHYGNHALFFAIERDAAEVVAVEPHPWNFDLLCQNVELNRALNITPVQALVNSEWETASAEFVDDLDEPWVRTMLPRFEEHGPIPCTTLDKLMGPGFDVVKIDAEEYGPAVLTSGLSAIREQRPLIAIEAEYRHEQDAIDDILSRRGYRCVGQYCATPTFLWAAGPEP
jgi:FkbM family methyltransferase